MFGAGSAGILISLHVATAQGGCQVQIASFFMTAMILSFVLLTFDEEVQPVLDRLSFTQTAGTHLGIVAVAGVVLLNVVIKPFRPSMLIVR